MKFTFLAKRDTTNKKRRKYRIPKTSIQKTNQLENTKSQEPNPPKQITRRIQDPQNSDEGYNKKTAEFQNPRNQKMETQNNPLILKTV